MSDPFMIAVGIIGNRDLTDGVLEEVMSMLAALPQTKNSDLAAVRRQLETSIGVKMSVGEGLTDGESKPWVDDIKANTKWHYWDSYVQQLRADNFPPPVIRTLDEDTDNILTQCGNPADPSSWRLQGLVMGDVQSGKTASYCGLISKAADTGYRFIVLLTGTIEDLRSQSQERLDEGFVGTDSRGLLNGETGGQRIGAGRFRQHTANVLTSIESDFLTGNRRSLRGIPLENIKEPVLLVMKKNKSALENLLAYLGTQKRKSHDQLRMPLFLVDDEADNASVNARQDQDPATINRLIREVMGRFHQATYVAYTATPFANVFINPEGNDLFPKNFIYSLNAPTTYIGAASIFTEDGEHSGQLVGIEDAEPVFPEKHNKDLIPLELPQSLQDAVSLFLISCAIRDLRNERLNHRSMLVNVTRFTDVQIRLADLLKNHLYLLTEEIKQYLADDEIWKRHPALVRLHSLFSDHYLGCGADWDSVRKRLFDSVASVKVVTINQKTTDDQRLNFRAYKDTEKGRRVIAIGGQTLSRGITLDGLCVSYFYRNSKAYDTLLQMGRWFGYRPGYGDLCRIWMTTTAQDWFEHIAGVVTELRSDIRRMHANRQPPRQFGIRVKSHPDTLLVTAANKMRNSSEVQINLSFSKRSITTPFVPKSVEANNANVVATSLFLQSLAPWAEKKSGYVWREVSASQIAAYLQQLEISPINATFIPDFQTHEIPIIRFIRETQIPSLRQWDVRIAEGDGKTADGIQFSDKSGNLEHVKKRQRQFEKSRTPVSYLHVNKSGVTEIADEKVGIDPTDLKRAEEDWSRTAKGQEGKDIPGWAYLAVRSRPLLTIHPIEPKSAKPGSEAAKRTIDAASIESKLLVAISLSFPHFEETEENAVPYRLNRVYLQNLGLIEEADLDEDED